IETGTPGGIERHFLDDNTVLPQARPKCLDRNPGDGGGRRRGWRGGGGRQRVGARRAVEAWRAGGHHHEHGRQGDEKSNQPAPGSEDPTPSARIMARSLTFTSSLPNSLTPSSSITKQNGQATAISSAPVARASSALSILTFFPVCSSIQNRAPPAPQHTAPLPCPGISTTSTSPEAPMTFLGAR